MSSSALAPLPSFVHIYEVGGAVRDAILGRPHADRDFAVVGATPEMMIAAGFKPVGKDFPVFLHPETHEEYALARTERKSGRGYHGFTFCAAAEVTLEEDLARRDLTVNAMALDENGELIDPFHGQRDLEARILRHVSPAFAEDPLRGLRVARFAAKRDFDVASETLLLMKHLVDTGEVSELTPERVWLETSRALMTDKPSRYLQVLRACGALKVLMPELDALYGVPQKPRYHPEIDAGLHVEFALDCASRWARGKEAARRLSLPVRWGLLCHDLGKALTPKEELPSHNGHEERGAPLAKRLSARMKTPRNCADAAYLIARFHGRLDETLLNSSPENVLDLLHETDAARRPERLEWLAAAALVDRNVYAEEMPDDPIGDYLTLALDAIRHIKAQSIVDSLRGDPKKIPGAIREAQLDAIRRMR
jgi:tRNA nucleotidyltransferase (CCA-adding enzyme)